VGLGFDLQVEKLVVKQEAALRERSRNWKQHLQRCKSSNKLDVSKMLRKPMFPQENEQSVGL
jgi:hypothetical protein